MPATPVVVLVEGGSDAAVVELLARGRGIGDRVEIVVMDGVTNARRHAGELSTDGRVVLGLCDARERRFLERLEPAIDGVFVCDRDLEDELIRALGVEVVLDVLVELGELERFRTFQGQPEWRGRDVADQLHRFAGTRSGRKAILARRLADRLTTGTTPQPLAQLLREVERHVR